MIRDIKLSTNTIKKYLMKCLRLMMNLKNSINKIKILRKWNIK